MNKQQILSLLLIVILLLKITFTLLFMNDMMTYLKVWDFGLTILLAGTVLYQCYLTKTN